MREFEVVKLLCEGKKIRDVAAESGLSEWKVFQIKKQANIKVKVLRGKDYSKMFMNSRNKLMYKTKSSLFKDSSDFLGF
jgi:DNA-binding NarL/FixJ family response regulator